MKKRHCVILIAALLLSTVATAQQYSIRANRGLNLRAEPSLYADIAGTVRTGDILQVLDHVGSWLQISRSGQVWLADWVNYSRVEGSEQTAAQTGTSTPIDNCCFVDRHCQSDQEWIDGYWAYQNGQCAAPTQTQVETPAQTSTTETSQVDNCCFAGWQCQTDQEWIDGYWAYQNNQCDGTAPAVGAGPDTSCCQLGWNCTLPSDRIMGEWFIEYGVSCGMPIQVVVDGVIIEGSEYFIRRVSEALALLKARAPEWHAYVIKGPLKIRAWEKGTHTLERSFNMAPGHVAESVVRRARVLVHESCHVQRWLAGLLRYETDLQQRTEENLCELAVDYMLDSVQPIRPHNYILEAEVNRLISDGVTNIHDLANAELQRAYHLLSTMN